MLQRLLITIFLLCILLNGNAQSKKIVMHDPVAIEAEGRYYVFGTGPGLEYGFSNNLETWHKDTLPVFNPMPEWFTEKVPEFNGHIWAPDIAFHNGVYYMYYSISSFGKNNSCIGVATNTTLNSESEEYEWADHGVVIQSVPGRDDWNAIDPNLIFDEKNEPWLAFGSFWDGLKIVKLNDDLVSIAQPQEWHTIASRNRDFGLEDTDAGNAAVEAPFIIKKDSYYYLFVSFDKCCIGAESTYNVRVGRSKTLTGPYIDKEEVSMLAGGGSLVIEGNTDYYAIGHNSVYKFGDRYYMFTHGYDVHDNARPKLLVHKLEWDAKGWPYVKKLIDN